MFHTEALWKYTDLKMEVDEETLASMEEVLDTSNEEKVREFEDFKKKCALDREILHSRVVLAALSVPLNEKSEDPYTLTTDFQKEKEARLAQLLGFDPHPNLNLLMQSLVANDMLDNCNPKVQAIYRLFEVLCSFVSLANVQKKTQLFQFAKDVNNALTFLDQEENFQQYKETIFETSFIKLLQQLSSKLHFYCIIANYLVRCLPDDADYKASKPRSQSLPSRNREEDSTLP